MLNPVFAQFLKEVWMMEPVRLSNLFGQFLSFDTAKLAELMKIEITKAKGKMQIENGIASISIHGLLMKNPPSWLAWFGIETTDYIQLANQLKEAAENPDVKSVMLHIDSPGGAVGGVSEAAEAIAKANAIKPVTAYIEDLGASAAYYLASQAGKISINPNGEAGSIGVYTVAVDSSKRAEELGFKVHVIKSGEHKGMGVPGTEITENQIAATQEIIDGMAANFKQAVSAGRKMSVADVEKIATGRTWLAEVAKKLNLVDEIVNGIDKSKSMQGSNMKGQTMPDPKSEQEIQKEAQAQAQAAEKQRMKDIKAAIPDDPAFAMEQFEKGASAVEAKAAYADKLIEKNKALQKEKDELAKKTSQTPAPEGGDPVANANADDGGNAPAAASDFMAEARTRAKEKKISMKDAMKQIASENPGSHKAFLEKCGQTRVKIEGKAKRIE